MLLLWYKANNIMRQVKATISHIKKVGKEKGYKVTDKQAIFIQEKLKGKSGTQSALAAYKTDENTAGTIAYENMQKPQVVNTFHAIMDNVGLTDEYLATKVHSGIENTSPEGKQSTYLELALKMKGKLQTVSVNLSHTIKENRKSYEL